MSACAKIRRSRRSQTRDVQWLATGDMILKSAIRLGVAVSTTLVWVHVASAHITLDQGEAAPGASYKAVFKVPHGCGKSATTSIRISLPEGIIGAKPMPKPGWTLHAVKGAYARNYPVMHGSTLSEGVKEITWSGGNLPDEYYDEFVVSTSIADSLQPNTTLYFPVVQTCENGEQRWTEIPTEGQDFHSLKSPAPQLHLVATDQSTRPEFRLGSILVTAPQIPATPKGAQVAAGYMTITNNGNEVDRLVGGTVDGAARLEIHEMTMGDGIMKMRPLANGLEIKAHETVQLKSGSLHIMAMGLNGGYADGAMVKGILKFEKAGEMAIEYRVGPLGGVDHSHH